MGALLGTVAGLGAVLIWQSLTGTPVPRSPATGWLRRRTEALRRAGVPGLTGAHLLVAQAFAGALAGVLVLALSRSLSVAACFAVFAALTPVAVVRRLQRRRTEDLREVWPEIVDQLTSAVRAGMSLPEGVAALATRGPEALRPAFARFAADHRSTGRFSDSLDHLRAELADPVADRVCESLRMAREVGGTDLGHLLRALSAFLREDARTRAELETRQGWTVNAARLAVAAPWVVLLLLGTQSTTLRAYDTGSGRVLLVTGAVVSVAAYRLMLRIGRLPDEPRVLR